MSIHSAHLTRRSWLGLALGASVPSVANAAVRRIDFGTMPPNQAPIGFTVALTGRGPPATWRVTSDPTARPGPTILTETTRDPTDERYPLAVLDDVRLRDGTISTRFRAVAGKVDRAAGLVMRYRDAQTYYVVRANALEDNVRLYRVIQGRREQFAGADIRVPSGQWQVLAVRFAGEKFVVSLDGREVFTAQDRWFSGPGNVGLWTKADSTTHFGWLEVEGVP